MSFHLILDHALPGAHPDRPKRLGLLFLLGVGVWLPVACGAAPEPNLEKADSYTLAPRLRVVTLSPSATRFVLALGGKALLVGVDSASKDLPGTEQLPSVSLESVRPLAPDLIVGPKLVLFVSKHTLTPVQRDAARRALPSEYPTLFFPFDPDGLSLTEFADVARRLRMQLKPQQGTP